MRLHNPMYAAAFMLAAACSSSGSGASSGARCTNDDVCPAGEICVSSLFGAICDEPKNKLCAENADCPTHESCIIRDKTSFLCSFPGPTRTTCEPKKCAADWVCGAGYECAEDLFGGGHYCARRSVSPDSGSDG